ncbi:hypothetical protein ACFQ1M_15615 [Sungkyunkwania multivorans]|uniref:Uncharacterized protein n=1 Tax=Sungkyunkwania multivorans TaxID=1173618 RepID=A0ABW3D3F4_9FLAO
MKKVRFNSKLSLKKFKIATVDNLSSIKGGSLPVLDDGTDTDGPDTDDPLDPWETIDLGCVPANLIKK